MNNKLMISESITVDPGIYLLFWVGHLLVVTSTTYTKEYLAIYGIPNWIEVDCRGYFEGTSMSDVKFIPDFKLQYNLSQEEIDALVKELKEIYETPKQIDCIGIGPRKDDKVPEVKSNCVFHEWVWYTGLNETFEHCKKCGEKKK